MTVHEMRRKKADTLFQSKEILGKAEREGRSLTADETKKFDKLHLEAQLLSIDVAEAEDRSRESEMNESRGRQAGPNFWGEPVHDESIETGILDKGQSLRSYVEAKGGANGYSESARITFPSLLRAMVAGPKNESERRALSEGSDSAGGFTVPDVLSAQLIDRMRATSTVFRAGAQTVPLTSDTTYIARLAGDPAAAWRLEAGTVAESSATFERVAFTARSLAVVVKASRELIEDSKNAEDALMRAFSEAMAGEVDRVALLGTGTAPEPLGIVNTTNVGSVSMGTNGATTASVGYAKLLDAVQVLYDANAGDPTAAIMAPRTAIGFAKLVDANNNPLSVPQIVQNIPFYNTSRIGIADTQGTAVNASKLIMGNFRDCMIGVRTSLRVEVLRERYADTLQYGFLATLRADVQLAHPESFVKIIGIIP